MTVPGKVFCPYIPFITTLDCKLYPNYSECEPLLFSLSSPASNILLCFVSTYSSPPPNPYLWFYFLWFQLSEVNDDLEGNDSHF